MAALACLPDSRHKLVSRTISADNPAYFSICVMEQDLYWASSHNRYINTLTRSDIVCLTTAVQPCAGCRLRRPNNFIQSRAVLCDRDSICIWELIKRLHQQNRKIVSSLAFQVILGFNVLIHLDLLILTQWKFISWKLKSDLRSKI